MSLYTLRTKETLPVIQSPPGLRIQESANVELLAAMGTMNVEDVISRMANDHVAFVAYVNNIPAAFGWMARGKAVIGEMAHEMILPIGNRYLWNFRTMEAFRGLGIYPALLQYVVHSESQKADRFWIIHAPENNSSLKGIRKAGFHYVGKLYTSEGRLAIENTALSKKIRVLLTELDVVILNEESASCWNCSSPYLKKRKPECCCASAGSECIGNNLHSFVS